jgi:hypothetical protein
MLVSILIFNQLQAQVHYPQKKIIQIDIRENDPVYKTASDIKVLDNKLYVLDNFGHHVIIYHIGNRLNFDKQFGRRGQGPGDFSLPAYMSVFDSTIAVKDGIGFSFFSKDGVFLKKFRTFSTTVAFAYHNNHIYCVVINPNKHHLIEVYEDTGKRIGNIGKKYLDLSKIFQNSKLKHRLRPYKVDAYFYSNRIAVDGNIVYYFDRKLGSVITFNPDGAPSKIKDISPYFGKAGKAIVEKNREFTVKWIPVLEGNRVLTYLLFESVRLVGNNIYIFGEADFFHKLMMNENRDRYVMRIRVLDKHSLELKKEYEIPVDRLKDGRIYSKDVVEIEGKPVFYFAMSNEEYEHYIAEYR